jgi:hypothetical protein
VVAEGGIAVSALQLRWLIVRIPGGHIKIIKINNIIEIIEIINMPCRNLDHNHISGTLPASLGNLTNLSVL